MLRLIKNWLKALVPSAIFLGITVYFGWNVMHGARGMDAQRLERVQLAKATQALAAVEAQRAEWETRIADLNDQSINPDLLDDQARRVLNLAQPSDLVVKLSNQTN